MTDSDLQRLARLVAEDPADEHALYALRCHYVRIGQPEKALPFRVGDRVRVADTWPCAGDGTGNTALLTRRPTGSHGVGRLWDARWIERDTCAYYLDTEPEGRVTLLEPVAPGALPVSVQ